MTPDPESRRAFLKSSMMSGSTIMLGTFFAAATTRAKEMSQHLSGSDATLQHVVPLTAKVSAGFLTAKLQWEFAGGKVPQGVILTIAQQLDPQHPIVQVALPGEVMTYALALVPNTTYEWHLQPTDAQGRPTVAAGRGTFKTGQILLKVDADKKEQFRNTRRNAHHMHYLRPTDPLVAEPLSPWYDVKRYTMEPPPKFADVKDSFPQPVLDGHPDALEAYWYCWKTFLDVCNFAPVHANHQAVANIDGIADWGPDGSNDVWDLWTIMHFAKYGHQAYPFITQFDNAYARQHENGFIDQEADNDNVEMYATHPAHVPFLIGYAEWDYYLASGDVGRLRRVFMPLVKNYEWFMTYMRHKPHGTYGFVTPGTRDEKGEVGPENLELGATVFRAAETLAMARIATLIDRPDMAQFFTTEHRRLGEFINAQFWDTEHQLYNDRCDPNSMFAKYRDPQLAGKFITEPTPGDINKSNYTFATLLAEIVPPKRVQSLKRLAQDQKTGFGWPTGIAYYSVDSTPQGYTHDASYFGPTKHNISVWPSVQYTVQQGFKQCGEWAAAREAGERYFTAVVAAYTKANGISEMMNATKPENMGKGDFIGWSGLGPIATFIEYVLGLDIDVPQKTIVWHVHRAERHGVRHLKLGEFYVDLLCAERATAAEPRHLTVTSGGSFTLQTVVGETVTRRQIRNGTVTLQVG